MASMSTPLPPLIQALLEPQRYPGAVARVELVQTHISWVLLAGEFAYKIKKPLKLPFLDYSTLALRLACCQEELRLNQRYASDIYLDVIGISHSVQDPQLGGPGPAIEYAVRMRRFDGANQLDRLCARGELLPAHLSDLAGTLAAFHATAAIAPLAARFGSPVQVMAPARDNFRDLLTLMPTAPLQTRLLALQQWTEAQFSQLQPLMAARQQSGRVRECHGDLHLANLVLLQGRVRLFDCIEFNDDLRWIDVACEMAFPYVDLLAHGQPGLAGWFLNEVLSCSGDYQAAALLRFYAVYLALVRAKVAAIRSAQTQADQAEAITHLALAERLTTPPPPRLVITHGLSGCGKTVASSQWLQADPQAATLRLRADVERKRLSGLAATAHSGSAVNAGLYSADAHRRTYGQLLTLADGLLRAGWSVLLDATFLRRADRDLARDLARQTGAAFAILAPQASPEQLRERILARAAQGQDASEATLAVLAQQMQEVEPLQADEGPVLRTPAST